MIKKEEILDRAKKVGLLPTTIEKDYVLSWVLAGIGENEALRNNLIFKGGTCLKKCYFGEYRFSEDLDFSIINQESLNLNFIHEYFSQVAKWIYNQSGIEISLVSFETYQNPRNHFSLQGKLTYRGPLKQKTNYPKIKIDITTDEIVLLNPVQNKIIHEYSDSEELKLNSVCYCFEEIFSEKIRALAQRARPRDLYDVIELYKQNKFPKNQTFICTIVEKKCKHVGIEFPNIEMISRHPQRDILTAEWENALRHQIPNLDSMETYWNRLPNLFEWLTR